MRGEEGNPFHDDAENQETADHDKNYAENKAVRQMVRVGDKHHVQNDMRNFLRYVEQFFN